MTLPSKETPMGAGLNTEQPKNRSWGLAGLVCSLNWIQNTKLKLHIVKKSAGNFHRLRLLSEADCL